MSTQQEAHAQIASDKPIPVITGITQNGLPQLLQEINESFTATFAGVSPPTSPSDASGEADPRAKRGGRVERSDARRYHTAGAIEDIKVRNVMLSESF